MSVIRSTKRGGIYAGLSVILLGCCGRATATSLEVKAQGSKTFYVDTAAGRNQISIESQSTLEDFTIVCNTVTGQWEFNPRNVERISGEFSVKVEDLRTGIPLRDHHLRGPDWLDAAKHPVISITIKQAEGARRTSANTAAMALVGRCSLHGVTRDIRIPCTFAYLDESPKTMERIKGDLIRLRAEFSIDLSDYGVKGPPGSDTIGLKVANTLPIKVSVFGSTVKPPPPLKVDKPGTATMPAGVPMPASPSSQPTIPAPGVFAPVEPSLLEPPTRPGP